MFTVHKPNNYRSALFWRLFFNYFLVILIPVTVASVLAHVLVVRTIEKDAAKLNDVVMSHFSEQTDTALLSLKTNMINMLSTSNLASLLRVAGDSPENQNRAELFRTLREQLINLQQDEWVAKTYLIFANHDLVVDADMYTDKTYFFDNRYPLSETSRKALFSRFEGLRMMEFFEGRDGPASAIMSYPFNTAAPEVYLVVDFHAGRFKELIGISESWVTGTGIVDSKGVMIGNSGLTGKVIGAVQEQLRAKRSDSQFVVADELAISISKSAFDESWYYVAVADLATLMKPAHITRLISWAFLVFFVVVGSIASYYLSRRLYRPILEIKEGLKPPASPIVQDELDSNEFNVIKRFSELIVTENKELSRLVHGMLPIVQEHFVTKMLLGEYRDALSIEYYAREIGFTYSGHAIRSVLCIQLHYNRPHYDNLSETSKSFMHVEIKERILKHTPSAVWLAQTKPGVMACVVHHDPFLGFGVKEAADTFLQVLEQYSLYMKATIGIGKPAHAIEGLHESYEQAIAALDYRGLHSGFEICSSQGMREGAQWDSFLSIQEVNRIFNQYKSREFDKLLQSAYEMLEEGKRRNATALQVRRRSVDVLNTWIRAAETEQNDFNIAFYSELYDRLNHCMTWEELRLCFRDIHALLFRVGEPDSRAKQFSEIVQYIHDHYNEELSIEFFAGMMNMSSGHFSRIFKEEVGEKYVEYVAKYRLSKAKQYLLDTNMKIDDIAEKVGYWGRNSFIRTFRKYEGITPAQYRSAHQS